MSSSESGHPSAPAGCHSWWRSWQASRLAIRQSETQRNRSNVVFSNHRLCDFSYSRSLSCGASHIPKPETGVPHKAWGRRSHNRHCLSCSFGAEGPGRLEPDEQWLSNQMIIEWNYYKMRSGVVKSNPPFSILGLNIMLPHNHIVGLIKQLLWAKCVNSRKYLTLLWRWPWWIPRWK